MFVWFIVCTQGMLAIGAALLGSSCVIGVEFDEDALDVALSNCEQFEDPLPVGNLVMAVDWPMRPYSASANAIVVTD